MSKTLAERIDRVRESLRVRSCTCALDFPEELDAIAIEVRQLEAREQARLSARAWRDWQTADSGGYGRRCGCGTEG